jgi:uncharacterized membrane protein
MKRLNRDRKTVLGDESMTTAARPDEPVNSEATRHLPTRAVPNWPLFSLALVGMGLTAYLTLTAWSGEALAGCTEESVCDVVLNSRWSKLFGLPTSLWGFLIYSSLAGLAWIKPSGTQWKWGWTICLFAVLYSGYLTAMSLFKLQAACPYCLSSATLFLVILGTLIYQRPRELPKGFWRPWIIKTATTGLLLVLALHLHYAGIW